MEKKFINEPYEYGKETYEKYIIKETRIWKRDV